MKKKRQWLSLFIIGGLLLTIGISWAWLQFTLEGTRDNQITAGTLAMELDESLSNGILLENAVPMFDEIAKSKEGYTFQLKNTGTLPSQYTIYLKDMPLASGEEQLWDGDLRYAISNNKGLDRTEGFTESLEYYNGNLVLDHGVLPAGETLNYKLNIWIASTANNSVMGTVMKKKIIVAANQQIEAIPNTLQENFSDNFNGIGIQSITFQNTKVIPENAVGILDVSAGKDGSVMAYIVDSPLAKEVMPMGSFPLYDMYIVADGKIRANENSAHAFEGMEYLKSLNFNNNFDTSHVSTMEWMFANCTSLTTLDLKDFNTAKVSDMSYMFWNCTKLTSLDTSSFNTSKVKTVKEMFCGTNLPNDYDYSHFDLSNALPSANNPFVCSLG